MRSGFTVIAVTSGRDAIRTFDEAGDNIRILVTDLTMPEMSGLELIRLVRTLHSKVEIVATSGIHAADQENLIRSGTVQHVLTKPFGPLALVKLARDIFASQEEDCAPPMPAPAVQFSVAGT